MEKVEGEIVSTGITGLEYHDREANNRIMGLIDYYKELIKDKGTFIDETVDDVKISIKIFGAIRDILVELKKLDGFDEQNIEETFQYWSEILETYKNTTMENIDYKNQNSIQSDLDSLIKLHAKDYISKGVSEPNANKGESKSQPVFDIIGTYQRELKRNTDIWNLDSRINVLLDSVNSMIELFETKYILTQEIPKTEVATSTSLMPMPQNDWFKTIISNLMNFLNRAKTFLLGNPKIIDGKGRVIETKVDESSRKLLQSSEPIDVSLEEVSLEERSELLEEIKEITDEEYLKVIHENFYRGKDNEERSVRAYSGKINNTEFIVNDINTNNGSITIIKMNNRCFGIKENNGEIEYIEIFFEKEYDDGKCELYMKSSSSSKRNYIMYDENMNVRRACQNTYFVEERKDGKFSIQIRGKVYGQGRCKFVYNSKDDFLENKPPLEIMMIRKSVDYDRPGENVFKDIDIEKYVKKDNDKYDCFESTDLGKGFKKLTKSFENRELHQVISCLSMVAIPTKTDKPTGKIEDFHEILGNAIKDGMKAIPKEVLDITEKLHPDIVDVINGTKKSDISRSNRQSKEDCFRKRIQQTQNKTDGRQEKKLSDYSITIKQIEDEEQIDR